MKDGRRFTSRSTRIVVNGVEYDRVEDVPEPYRTMLADRDGDGLPDIAQDAPARRVAFGRTVVNGRESYSWNGTRYDSIEDMPPEAREFVRRHMGADGPNMLREGAVPAPAVPGPPVADAPGRRLEDGYAGSRSLLWPMVAAVVATAIVVGLIAALMGWL